MSCVICQWVNAQPAGLNLGPGNRWSLVGDRWGAGWGTDVHYEENLGLEIGVKSAHYLTRESEMSSDPFGPELPASFEWEVATGRILREPGEDVLRHEDGRVVVFAEGPPCMQGHGLPASH